MIILTDSDFRENLFPFTHTRHTADIRIGILTVREKWELLTGEKVSTAEGQTGTKIPANIIPTERNFTALINSFSTNEADAENDAIKTFRHPHDIFLLNDYALREDYSLLTKGRVSMPLSTTNKVISPENIFIEDGAIIEHSILNASAGPVYIGKNAEIMEGCLIRGPFSLGEGSKLKMGTKIYGATTIGPNCVAGGEIKNSVLFANSNKAHDGYLGDSVIGEWCNLGAGTSNSNVKNTGGEVKYVLAKHSAAVSAANKGGLLMGDYSRAAINTSFNTGTTAGVCCNIFGDGRPPTFIENFTWGNENYIFEKAIRDIDNWKKMKGQSITEQEVNILRALYKTDSGKGLPVSKHQMT